MWYICREIDTKRERTREDTSAKIKPEKINDRVNNWVTHDNRKKSRLFCIKYMNTNSPENKNRRETDTLTYSHVTPSFKNKFIYVDTCEYTYLRA